MNPTKEQIRQMYEREETEWSDEELLWELRRIYTPDPIPPCRVCGRPLSIASVGGGQATRYACSNMENDPDRPGYLRRIADWDPADDHYARSVHTDYKSGGDSRVLELIRRFEGKCHPA